MSDHVLHLGDCLDGMKALTDKSVDHVICDPPYEAEAHTLGRRAFVGRSAEYVKGGVAERPLSFAAITEAEREEVARQCGRLARRWILVFCQVEASHKWAGALTRAGAVYRRTMVWIKPGAAPQFTGDRPGMGYESVVCAHAPGRSRWNAGGKHGVYTEPPPAAAERHGHDTPKPIALMEALVRDFTDPGELVCDPFAGSGTTGVACKRLGRRFIGWEKDPKFHAAAVKRIDAAREQFQLERVPKAKQTSFAKPAPALSREEDLFAQPETQEVPG